MKSTVLLISAIVTLVVGGVLNYDVNAGNLIEDNARIANGTEVRKGDFPWHVGIYIKSGSGPNFCSGTLIGRYYVLTSAYCIHNAVEVEVVLGAHNITEIEDEQMRMVTREFFPHDFWDPGTMENDIALIKLPRSAYYTDNIQFVRLWWKIDTWTNVPVNITGWGKTSPHSELSDVLQYTVAHVVEDKYCYNIYGDLYNNTKHFCVQGGAICEGDEGGPLNYLILPDRSYVVGVASYSTPEACKGQSNIPSVYTQIYIYHEWIEQFTALPHP